MSRPRLSVPAYRLHKPTGKAVVTAYLADGSRRDVYLPGRHGSAESRAAYGELVAELKPGGVLPGSAPAASVTDLCVAYLKHAQAYYTAGGECPSIRDALRVLRAVRGPTPAAEFGPLALKEVRAAMVGKGWSRQYVNRQVGRVVRAFKWAAAEELVPATAFQALRTLAPLREGKTEAPEAPPRVAANPEHVAAALPFLAPHVRAMVELMRLTGMRPVEACRMTLGQIDRSGGVWLYSSKKHKNEHRGKHRTVALGAAAQAVIVAHLGVKVLGPDEPLFSPRRQREERMAAMRERRAADGRGEPRPRKADPKRVPGERYDPAALCHATAVACRKAKVPAWSPYQLRHLVGAELRERFTLEHVRAALGHSHAGMSAHYAKGADLKLAGEVAGQVG